MRDMLSHFDIEIVFKTPLAADLVEKPSDRLGFLMIRGHSGAHQPVRGGQFVKHIDPHAALGEQLVGCVHAGWAGSDDRDGQYGRAIAYPRRRQYRRQLGGDRKFSLRAVRVVGRVDRDERQLRGAEPTLGQDRVDRTGADAGPAVHTRHRVDVQHFSGGESRFVRAGVDAVDRAGIHARAVATARLRDDVGHGGWGRGVR